MKALPFVPFVVAIAVLAYLYADLRADVQALRRDPHPALVDAEGRILALGARLAAEESAGAGTGDRVSVLEAWRPDLETRLQKAFKILGTAIDRQGTAIDDLPVIDPRIQQVDSRLRLVEDCLRQGFSLRGVCP